MSLLDHLFHPSTSPLPLLTHPHQLILITLSPAVKPQINSSLTSNCTNSQGHLTSSEANNASPSSSSSSPLKKLNCNSPYEYNDHGVTGHHNHLLQQHHHHHHHHLVNYNDHSIGPGSTITTLTCNSKPVQHVVKPSFKADLEVSVTWSLVKLYFIRLPCTTPTLSFRVERVCLYSFYFLSPSFCRSFFPPLSFTQ